MKKEELLEKIERLRSEIIKDLHDYVANQPDKAVDIKESIYESVMVVDGEAKPVTYNHISIFEDSSVGAKSIVVNYTDHKDGKNYAEVIEDFSFNEIYDIIRLL